MLFMTMSITPTCLAAPAVTDARMDSQALFRAYSLQMAILDSYSAHKPFEKAD